VDEVRVSYPEHPESRIYYAHRGNVDGPDPSSENSPDQIDKAISLGFRVEVDVWSYEDTGGVRFWLGHDGPQYLVEDSFFAARINKLLLHAKNRDVLEFLLKNKKEYNVFWHDKDNYAITSNGTVISNVGLEPVTGGIIMLPENVNIIDRINLLLKYEKHSAICTDYPIKFWAGGDYATSRTQSNKEG
jgi:hypothetical protein